MEGFNRFTSFFESKNGNKIRICYGPGIDDIYINEKGIELNFEQAIYETLLAKGFQRIVFFSPHRSLYAYDNRSLSFDEGSSVLQPNQMEMGPLRDYAALKINSPSTETKNGIGDVHALRIIDQIMRNDSGPLSIVIFLQAETSLKTFEDHRTLSGLFGEWFHLKSENQNKCILAFSIDDYENLQSVSRELPVPEVRNYINREKGKINYIGGPEEDEIERGLKELFKNGIKIPNLKDLSRKLINEKRNLREWDILWEDHRLKGEVLTYKKAGELGWFKAILNPEISARDKLQQLVGLESIKNRIDELVALLNLRKDSAFNSETFPNLHMIFSGNPGTGKTTVARLIGELFHEMGWLKRGHLIEVQAGNLIADYVGGTAIKTNQFIDQALDGILFIDEAYGLTSKDRGGYNQEALEILLSRMETERDRLVVICAGYADKMVHFRQANPGLSRRFPEENIIQFDDFDEEALFDILRQMINARNLKMNDESEMILKSIVKEMVNRRDQNFGNAGEMRNLTDSIERLHASRIAQDNLSDNSFISIDDIPANYQTYIPSMNNHKIEYGWEEALNKLVGLQQVKEYFHNFAKRLEFEKLRSKLVSKAVGRAHIKNFAFLGNPGTGKTTVARLIGKMYKDLGLLSKGHTVEVTRADLISGFLGQTALKTNEVIQKALDGILFIDEAYSLLGQSENDYGYEAIQALIKGIDDYKNKLCVVIAGYPEGMFDLLSVNPGLKSRFSEPINFPDFTIEELCEILNQIISFENYTYDDGFLDGVKRNFEWMKVRDGKNFGNARSVREFFESIKSNAANRILDLIDNQKAAATAELLSVLKSEDIPEPGFYLELDPIATTNANARARV